MLPPLKGHRSGLTTLLFSPDGKTLVSGSVAGAGGDNTIKFWNVATGREMLEIQGADLVSCTCAAPADKFLLWREHEGLIRVTKLPTLAEIDAAEKETRGEAQ